MGLTKLYSTILKAKASKALDKAEDPRETLDCSYQRMLEKLTQVRRGVADVATSRKRLELQASQLTESGAKVEAQARQAIAQNREDLAREALSRRAYIVQQLQDLKAKHDQLDTQESQLTQASQRLQSRVESFRTRKETIKATYTAAQATTKVNEAVSGISEEMGDVGMAIQRAEDKTAQMQARAGALDELMASGALDDLSAPGDHIQAELDRGLLTVWVDAELEPRRRAGTAGRGAGDLMSTRYPKDPGLSARMAVTIFLLGLLYVAFIGALLAVGVSYGVVIVIAGGLLFVQYFFSDKIALFSMHARVVSEQEAPELHAIVDRLCALADMPKPRVGIAESDVPNAFATGRSPKAAVVCVTTGIMRRLDNRELEAVLSHELPHGAP